MDVTTDVILVEVADVTALAAAVTMLMLGMTSGIAKAVAATTITTIAAAATTTIVAVVTKHKKEGSRKTTFFTFISIMTMVV